MMEGGETTNVAWNSLEVCVFGGDTFEAKLRVDDDSHEKKVEDPTQFGDIVAHTSDYVRQHLHGSRPI